MHDINEVHPGGVFGCVSLGTLGCSSSEEDIWSCNDPKFETCEVHTFFTSPDFCGITISSYIPKLHINNPKSKKMPRTRDG